MKREKFGSREKEKEEIDGKKMEKTNLDHRHILFCRDKHVWLRQCR